MKRLGLALVLVLTPGCVAAQGGAATQRAAAGPTSAGGASATGAKTIVILARHAEKASETDTDPPLSERGHARAAALAEALRDARISGAVVSERLRTHQTARPTLGPIVPDTISIAGGVAAHARAVAERIRGRHAGGTVLVVGHSNTIPAIMTALGAGSLPDICDAAYGNLYIMILAERGPPQVLRTKYGPPDPPGADACPGMRAP
jgi:phosphohistidine phosphatase SixA